MAESTKRQHAGRDNTVSDADFKTYVKTLIAESINPAINELLKQIDSKGIEKLIGTSKYQTPTAATDNGIAEPANYLLNMGGNRNRPVLMLTLIEALGGDQARFLPFAIIPEMIHNATLVHDDIEDNSPMRRNKEAVHVKFGLPIANNLGDFMYYFPTEAVLEKNHLPPEKEIEIVRIYRKNMLRATVGQSFDLAWSEGRGNAFGISESEYLRMVELKSGALLRMAAEMAGALSNTNQETMDVIGRACMAIGIAFQIIDDIDNLKPSEIASKKGGIGEDITGGKITVMAVHALKVANYADKARLIAILKEHTKDSTKINEAIAIMDKYGSFTYSRTLAKQIADGAWDELDKTLPSSIAKERIRTMIRILLYGTG
jgi:geranylgeranyl pyrophosphate synthase